MSGPHAHRSAGAAGTSNSQAPPALGKARIGLGPAIQRHRERCRLTQTQLAERAGLHSTTVSHIENERHYPNWPALWDLSAALEVRPSLLVRDAEELCTR